MKELEQNDSDKLDELAKLLRELDKRKGLSFGQIFGLLVISLLLIFLIGPITVVLLGSFGAIFASVFIAMLLMFIYEGMRSSNVTKRSGFEKAIEEVEDEEQETLEEAESKNA